MRTADTFLAGIVAGALSVWLWGDEIERLIGARTRDARDHTADTIEAADSLRV